MVKTSNSKLSKLGNRLKAAHEQHKDDETKFSAGRLPTGIENGIAQLTEASVGEYDSGDLEGELFIRLVGTVVYPKVFLDKEGNSHPIEGAKTSYMEPLCDTPERTRKTLEDHLAHAYNELRKLGINTSDMSPDDLEATLETLVESGVYFKFRTWSGKPTEQYPEPRVNEVWNGVCEYEVSEEDEVHEEKPAKTTTKEASHPPKKVEKSSQVAPAPAKQSQKPAATKPTVKEEPKKQETKKVEKVKKPAKPSFSVDNLAETGTLADSGDEDAQTFLTEVASQHDIDATSSDYQNWESVAEAIQNALQSSEESTAETEGEVDLDALAEAADNNDEDSQQQLHNIAAEYGIDSSEIGTWTEVAEAIKAASGEPEESSVEVGQLVKWTNPKTKKASSYEVTSVSGETVSLKSATNPKLTFKDIKITDLEL